MTSFQKLDQLWQGHTEIPVGHNRIRKADIWVTAWRSEHPGRIPPTKEQFLKIAKIFGFQAIELGIVEPMGEEE